MFGYNKIIRKQAELDGLEAQLTELIRIKNDLLFSPYREIGNLTEKISLLKREIGLLEIKSDYLKLKKMN